MDAGLFADGKLKWSFDPAKGVLTISPANPKAKVEMPSYTSSDSYPWHIYSGSIVKVVIAKNVTSIGNNAFNSYYNLASVTIAGTVTKRSVSELSLNAKA